MILFGNDHVLERKQDKFTMNRKVKRGEIYWFDFGQGGGSIQNGRRPAIIIQADSFNKNSPTTVVAPITSVHKCRHLPSHIFIGEEFGLAQPSMILLEQIRTINQDSLGPYIGIVDDKNVLNTISSGLKKTLNLWHYWTPKSDVRCLCYHCLQEYMDTQNYSISRVDPFQKVKDSCDRCGRPGYDYTLKEKKRKA